MKIIFGNGINDGKYPANRNKKSTKEYSLWYNMLLRCYSNQHRNRNKTYIDCEVSENFKHFSYFHEWCQYQVGFKESNFQLDKDLLFKNNKLYSENNCVFVPKEINCLLTKSNMTRGDLPIGVSYSKLHKKFRTQCHNGKRVIYLGLYSDINLAFSAYKDYKETLIKNIANEYVDKLDIRAYNALMNYVVDFND